MSNTASVTLHLHSPTYGYSQSLQANIKVLDAEALLEMAIKFDPPGRVILDVGAQVLLLRNDEVAARWLSQVSPSEALACIYFDDKNDLCVLSHDGEKSIS